jgi:energy-coupling factor transporter ATPase
MWIRLEGVSFAYPRDGMALAEAKAPDAPADPVLSDVSFTIGPGEFVAILGPNGSGKSTLARLIGGLLRPTAGRVEVDGLDTSNPAHLAEVRRRVGIVFQDPDAQLVATVVEEDVAFGLENRAVPREEMRRRVDAALRAVGLEAHRRRPPHQLSGGQKQRCAIAGWLAVSPACIIFDEATSMLDVEGRAEVMAVLEDLRERGLTLITITHHMEEALRADRVIVLHRGRVELDGPPREVFQQVDRLRALRLDTPAATEIAARLRRDGWPIGNSVLTADELAGEAARLLGTGGPAEAAASRPDSASSAPAASGSGTQSQDAGRAEALPAPAARRKATGEALVVVEGVSHTYLRGTPMAQTALRDVTFTLTPGETTAVVGRTGSGKSTLAQILAALIVPEEGTVVIDGIQVRRERDVLRQVRHKVGLVMQRPESQLFEALVGDDIAYGPLQQGLSIEEARERVRFAMEAVGLDFAWRRKVALAGVIALMPRLLILDEPTAGLDPASRDELLERLRLLAVDRGMTLLLITHRMEEVAALADRVLALQDGRLAWDGPTREWFADEARLKGLGMGLPDAAAVVAACRRAGVPLGGTALTRAEAYERLADALRERVPLKEGGRPGGRL